MEASILAGAKIVLAQVIKPNSIRNFLWFVSQIFVNVTRSVDIPCSENKTKYVTFALISQLLHPPSHGHFFLKIERHTSWKEVVNGKIAHFDEKMTCSVHEIQSETGHAIGAE